MNPNIVPLCKTILGLNNFQLGGRGIQGERKVQGQAETKRRAKMK